MTDEKDIEADDEAPADVGTPQAGGRLAAARREQQITVVEVAKELHLDERKVRALEQNEFDVLGAPVFAKGHLRKYAQLVGVPVEDVLADYYELNRANGMPPVVGNVRKPARELTPGPWLAVIVAAILIASAYWYYVVRDSGTTAVERSSPASDAVEPPAAEAQQTDDGDVGSVPQTPAEDVDDDAGPAALTGVAEPVEADVSPQPAAIVEPPPVADGALRLTLTFTGDCWTEITDAGGRQLFFDLGRDGRVANVTGQAPLAVLFGNADNVSLRVNGEPFEITAADRRGQTARLTIRSPE